MGQVQIRVWVSQSDLPSRTRRTFVCCRRGRAFLDVRREIVDELDQKQ